MCGSKIDHKFFKFMIIEMKKSKEMNNGKERE